MKVAPYLLLVLAWLIGAFPASAQALSSGSPLTTWDASIGVGSLLGRRSDFTPWDSWHHTGAFAAEVGKYWTSHLKTSITIGRSGEGSMYSQQQVTVPGLPAPQFTYDQHFLRRTNLAGVVSYQFFDNAWIHPYVSAGVDTSWERDRMLRTGFSAGPRPALPVETVHRSTRVRPLMGAGAKLYMSPRAFVRTDIQFVPGGDGRAYLGMSGGIGVDLGSKPPMPALPAVRAPATASGPADLTWRQFAQRLAPGTRIALLLQDGTRMKATLLNAADDAVTVQPKTRLAVPVQKIPYVSIAAIETDEQRGIGPGKAIGIGVGSGVGAFLGMLLIMLANID